MTLDRNSELIQLAPAPSTVSAGGVVISEVSGMPVGDVVIDFGNGWAATSSADGMFGPVAIPPGDYGIKLSRDEFIDTYRYPPTLTADTTNMILTIAGGEVSVYGEIMDGNGYVVTDATVSVVESTALSADGTHMAGASGEPASGAGYYDVTVAKGTRTYMVSAPGYEPQEIRVNVSDHTKRNVILIPEPAAGVAAVFALMIALRRWRLRS
jgi:hypothetical protein